MAQTMKEIITESFSKVSSDRLRELLPTIVRDAKSNEFLNPDNDLSALIKRCLDESNDGGMIGILLPVSGVLRPYAIINRGGILGTEELDSGGFGIGNRGKKALAKTLLGLLPVAQKRFEDALADSEKDKQREEEEKQREKEEKKKALLAQQQQEEKEKYKTKINSDGDAAYRALRTGRVFRPEMPEMLKTAMMSQAVAYGGLDNKTVEEFEAQYTTEEMNEVFVRTAEILDNEIAKRSQMAADALESKEALWDFITGYQSYLSSKKFNFRDKLINHGDTAFEELYNLDANDDVQLWKVPEMLKQIYLGYLASDEELTETDIDDCKADPNFDKAVDLVGNIVTMNIRLGTLNPNPGTCRNEIIRQIEAARKQLLGR
jgi:hypothetical protein